ncbi:MAG: ComEC/Rec2 family competence protein [Chloroflexota bacterium]
MPIGRFALPAALGGFAGGILFADTVGPVSAPGLAVLGAVAGTATVLCAVVGGDRARRAMVLGAVAALALVVGSWRGAAADAPPAESASVASLVDGAEHTLVGAVVDDPRPRGDRLQIVLADVLVAGDGGAVRLADRLLVRLPRGIAVESGDRVRLATRVELPEDFDGFAYREYLARQGIGGIGEAQSVERVGRPDGPAAWLPGIRNALLDGINRLVPEPEAALGAGILLGVRSAIAPEINEAFARAGLTHVVAISGWNIAIVAALVAAVARPVERRGGRWSAAVLVTATVAGYVVLTGATPSVLRAALMAGALLVGRLGGSRAHAGSALGLAALVMLVVAPALLWDVGFQLSLLATGGLIWFGGPIERRLSGWPGLIREPVALTLAAQVTTLPVILVNFERLSLVAPVANVLVVPFVPIAMLFSAVAAAVGVLTTALPIPVVSDAAAWLAGGAAWLVLRTIVALGTAVASVPHAAVDVTLPAPLAVAWLPIVALAAWALDPGHGGPREPGAASARAPGGRRLARVVRQLARPLPLAAGLVLILGAISLASLPDGRLHLTVLDVGQGDAILVETPSGATMLVDGGPDPELTLRRVGVNLAFFDRRIDLMLLSHPHQDHVAGLVDVLDRFSVGALLHGGIHFDNQAYDQLLADAAHERTLAVRLARAGQVVRLDEETSIEVLYPSPADAAAPLPYGDINNGSVVVLLRYGEFEALLTGDAEAPIEEILLRRGLVPRVDLLKVGHHGSASSTTAPLLGAARPGVAVISAGADNEYGHPAFETLRALGAVAGVAVHRTDRDGDVEIVTDGRSFRVHTDAGWSEPRPLAGGGPTPADAGSIGACQSPTAPRHAASSTRRSCPTASWFIPRESLGWPPRPPGCWRRRRSRSTAPSSRRRRCSMTSTRSRSAAPAASTGSSARDGSRPRAIPSSRCRSPPTRSAACSTTTASHVDGPRCWWPSPTATSRRRS